MFQQLEARVDRAGGTPLLPSSLLQHHAFMTGLTASALHYTGMMAFFLVLTLCLQNGRQLSAVYMDVAILLLAIIFLITLRVANVLARRYGVRALLVSFGLMVLGLLALLTGSGTEWAHPTASSMMCTGTAMALCGAEQGLAVVPLIDSVLTGVARMQAGATAGLPATAQQLAGTLGVAYIGELYFTFTAVGGANGVARGMMAEYIAILAAFGTAAVGSARLGAQQRQLAAAGTTSPA